MEIQKVEELVAEAKREARATLQAELSAAEAKHKKHTEEMIKEWQFERKVVKCR